MARNLTRLALSPRTRHGAFSSLQVLPGECPTQLDELRAAAEEHFRPIGGADGAIVEQLVGVLHRLRRLDRAERIVFETWRDGFLADGPGPDPSRRPASPKSKADLPAALVSAVPAKRTNSTHTAYERLTQKIVRLEERVETDRDAVANIRAVAKAYGLQAAAMSVKQWVCAQADFGELAHEVALKLPDEIGDPATYVNAFIRDMKNAARRAKHELTPLLRRRDDLEGRLAALFVAGAASMVDPSAPTTDALERQRAMLLNQHGKLLRALAATRALRHSVIPTDEHAGLRAINARTER